jgi:hypothetical protein
VGHATADDRHINGKRRQVFGRHGAGIAGEDDQIGQLAGSDGPLAALLEGGERAVQREHAQRLLDRHALPRPHALPALPQARHRRA